MSEATVFDDVNEEIGAEGAEDLDVTEYYGERSVRWYQIAIRNAVAQYLSQGFKRLLIKAPTGSGKTITLAFTLNSPEVHAALNVPADRKIRVLFIAHKHRLLTQAETTFAEESGVDITFQSAFSAIPQAVIDKGWDVAILDEAHHEAMFSLQQQLMVIGDFPIIGATATDERADGCVIKFEKIIEPLTREEAVEQGYLAPTRLHSIVDPTSKSKVEIVCSVLKEYHEQIGQMMIFMKTVKEAEAVNNFLANVLGKKTVIISKQSEAFVNTTLNHFSDGEIQFVVNCNKINEGVDVKGCTDVFCARQYGSYPQLNQVIGRAARPDSDCNVWELINPLSSKNLDTTVIVGTPEMHRLLFIRGGKWEEREFDYTSSMNVMPTFNRQSFRR